MKRLLRKLGDESGQVMVLAVLALTAVLGLVAFAVDVGLLLRVKRVQQTAADSAALAAAAEYNNSDFSTAPGLDAAQNGISAAAVTVNSPPQSGPHKGTAGTPNGYVEVIVSQSQPTFFMKLFHLSSLTVSARAVATTVPGTNCVYTLGGSGTDISLTGSGNLTMPSCSILDDSSSGSALTLTGSGNISANSIGIVGGYRVTGSGSVSPTPITGMAAVPDPLSLTAPTFVAASCNAAFSNTGSTSVTITGPSSPGGTICYNGFSNTGSGTVTFPAGTYVINGNFTNTGSAGLTGTGVTFYLPSAGDKFSITGSGSLNLTAPTSGTYSGILFYQDPSDTSNMSITGSSSSTLNGIFYAPTAELDLTGSGGAAFNTDLVVSSLSITGSVNLSDYVPLAGASPLSTPRLVE